MPRDRFEDLPVGTNTFRGTRGSTFLRETLYAKNEGSYATDSQQLRRTDSPISGNLLVSRESMSRKLKDPISGTLLRYSGGRAQVTAPLMKQELNRSKEFYLTRDIDVTIQQLRNTTKVSRYTNEKVGWQHAYVVSVAWRCSRCFCRAACPCMLVRCMRSMHAPGHAMHAFQQACSTKI